MPAPPHREFLDSAVLARLSRLSVNARAPMLGTVTGIHRSATRGSSVEFAEYRKYVPGDDVRHVDWRVYARTDRFYMKEFEADTNLRCMLVFDTSGSMAFAGRHGSRLAYARRLAATLAYLLAHQGDAIGLLCVGAKDAREIAPRRSPAHLKVLFDELAGLKPYGQADLVTALHGLADRLRRRALVLVFSDLFAEVEPLMRAFRHLRFQRHDVAAFHLLDDEELAFEFDRPIRFVDLESPFQLVTDPAVIASDYRRELDGWLGGLQRGCREFGVDYQRVTTEQDYEKVLAAFLLPRMRRRQGPGGRA